MRQRVSRGFIREPIGDSKPIMINRSTRTWGHSSAFSVGSCGLTLVQIWSPASFRGPYWRTDMRLLGSTVLFSVLLQAMVGNKRAVMSPLRNRVPLGSTEWIFTFKYLLCVRFVGLKFPPLKFLVFPHSLLQQRTGRRPHRFMTSLPQILMATWFPSKNTSKSIFFFVLMWHQWHETT